MSMTRSIFKRKMELHVVGGQNLLSRWPRSKYVMRRTFSRGIVRIGFRKFYYLGFEHSAAGERSVGKAAGGAVIGSVFAPIVGTVIGGAIGARKKNTSTATLVFADIETRQTFSVTVACDAYLHKRLSRLGVARLPAEGSDSSDL